MLDVYPDLVSDLRADQRVAARAVLMLPAIQVGPGRWQSLDPQHDLRLSGEQFGLLIAQGLMVREIKLGQRASRQLYGPGDLFDLNCDDFGSLAINPSMSCPITATVAVLDDQLLIAMRRWPRLISRFFAHTMRQIDRAAAHQAISQLDRVEDRLLAVLWHLADRWGRARLDGVAIDLQLTHEALGELIGARRPTVTLGLRALADQQLLGRGSDGRWLLSPDSLAHLNTRLHAHANNRPAHITASTTGAG